MTTKNLSEKTLATVEQYMNFHIGASDACNIPYFNNNHKVIRAGLRATIGKGSPRDIFEEVEIELAKHGSLLEHSMTSEALKHILVERNIGIDCSGFAYYVLSAESAARGTGTLDRRLQFPFCAGIIGKIRSKMRPAENADVATLAHDSNSRQVPIGEISPGDIVTMLNTMNKEDKVRDHILVVSRVEYRDDAPTIIHYIHSIAWPSDGEYGHGVRAGTIEIVDIRKSIAEQKWIEAGKTGPENYTAARARKSLAEIRRLRWF